MLLNIHKQIIDVAICSLSARIQRTSFMILSCHDSLCTYCHAFQNDNICDDLSQHDLICRFASSLTVMKADHITCSQTCPVKKTNNQCR